MGDLDDDGNINARHTDLIARKGVNPYLHFIVSEIWSSLAAMTVFGTFLLAGYGVDHLTATFALKDPAPINFLSAVLAWSGSLCAALTFVVVTLYQLLVLVRRLKEDWSED